jgi:hypothetical protein
LQVLSEALVGDITSMLEGRGVLQDAFQATELLRQMQESQFEIAREVTRLVFTSLASDLPGADKDLPAGQLEASMRRQLPRVDLAAMAAPAEKHFPLLKQDVLEYVTPATYSRLAELQSILTDARQRLQNTKAQEMQIQAVKSLTTLTFQIMRDAGSGDVIPRVTVIGFNLGQRFLIHAVGDMLDRLMLAITARFAADPEEFTFNVLRPLNSPVLTAIERAAYRVKGEESEIFTSRIQPALQAEIIRSALIADDARVVTLDPKRLQATLQAQGALPVKRAIWGTPATFERWRAIAQAMDHAQGRRSAPVFTALAPGGVPEGETQGLVFAPASLARVMSDPQAGRALLVALKAPQTLSQSQVAMRLRAESIQEMHGEVQTH